MPNFRYKAVSAGGEMIEGSLDAADRSAVVEQLRDQGHFPLNVETGGGETSILHRDLFGGGRASQRDLTVATRELSTLLQAGLPLDRALRVLIDVAERQSVREMLARVLERVQGGASLADALDGEGSAFPRYYVGMVRAGEAGGTLYDVLSSLADFMERMRALRGTVLSALIYPAILLVVAVLTVAVLFVWVLPEFRPVFANMENLPVLTEVFLAVGDFLQNWWWAVLGIVVLAVLVFLRRLRDPDFRLRWDRLKLRLPLFGDLQLKVETARFAHTLAMLLRGGQPLLEALGVLRDVIGNTALRDALRDIAVRLRQGQGLAVPLAESGMFPALAVHLVRVGEESGRLEELLERLGEIYDLEVRETIQRLLAMLVPLLTLFLGGFVFLIIASVLGAFLSVNEGVF